MSAATLCLLIASLCAPPVDGNRLAYLDGHDIYYPHTKFPKLITPQWVGEEGVEAVVILAIDDMRDTAKYESYLRPILQRLKQIDGRAPVSIMTCAVKPDDPQLQTWLQEGVSLEVHTFDHPCPLLQGSLEKAKGTYDKCVDLLFEIPNNTPVAYRMPCCDSLNTVSPRFYKEIFNKTTPNGKFLQISSSVFQVYTADDPEIPRELLFDADGKERFRKYFPKGLKRGDVSHDRFLNYVENYPYPYVIGNMCWEFPCMTPSDWEANFLHQPNNPQTVGDLKAALDITVLKQGVLNLVFHPHGWIKAEQVNELIDHAVAKHGKKVKFLTFKEALERLNKNLLAGDSLREVQGRDNGVWLLDADQTGFLDVIKIGTDQLIHRTWNTKTKNWSSRKDSFKSPYTPDLDLHLSQEARVWSQFGILPNDGVQIWMTEASRAGKSTSTRGEFLEITQIWEGLNATTSPRTLSNIGQPGLTEKRGARAEITGPQWVNKKVIDVPTIVLTNIEGKDFGTRLRDIDGDGVSELLISNPAWNHVNRWSEQSRIWESAFPIPAAVHVVDKHGTDAGLRFIDINADGKLDLVFSNAERFGVWLFESLEKGWSIELLNGKRGDQSADQELPPIVRADGTDNGFFVRDRALHWQNEDTAHLPNLVVSWDFDKLLGDRLPAAKTPRAAIESMRPTPGFTVELMAHEPLVMDPVAFQWAPDGKLWVAEMADYPNGMDGRGQPGGRIRYLEDTDHDGQYDKSTLFLDGVPFPSGVHPRKNGVLISAAPDIFFAADTDGDGKADVKEVLYSGFVEGNQQHRVNGFTWGLDGWLYVGNGDSGGTITSTKTGKTLEIRGRDLRIKPDTGEMEAINGQTQFGRSRDDWGNWFGNNNSRPMWQYVLEDEFLSRNPHLTFPDSRRDVSEDPGPARIYPASKTLTRFNDFDRANRFTSACSAIVGGFRVEGKQPSAESQVSSEKNSDPLSDTQHLALSPPLYSFVSEPVHNLVHREVLSFDGIRYRSRRVAEEQESEFLASTDNWFRPTQLRMGPDGALWIADMYRLVIEHPQWIPQEWQEKLDVRAGDDKGRLWRIFPTGAKLRPVPRLDTLNTEQLIAALDSPNRWQRDMVQQLLTERLYRTDDTGLKWRTATRLLYELSLKSEHPEVRLQARATRQTALRTWPNDRALRDPHPLVRAHAIRIGAESMSFSQEILAVDSSSYSRPAPKPLFPEDLHPSVQLQFAAALGPLRSPEASAALAKLLISTDDPDIRAIGLSSLTTDHLPRVVEALFSQPEFSQRGHAIVDPLVAYSVAVQARAVLVRWGEHLLSDSPSETRDWQWSAVETWLTTQQRAGKSWSDWLTADTTPSALRQLWTNWLSQLRPLIVDASVTSSRRAAALRIFAATSAEPQAVLEWLAPTQPIDLQLAAVTGVARLSPAAATAVLIDCWPRLSPTVRAEGRKQLLGHTEIAGAFLKSIHQGGLSVQDIDPETEQFLRTHRDPAVRQQADAVLLRPDAANRSRVVAQYLQELPGEGDAAAGRELFAKRCAQCHKLGDLGQAVGPDLAALTDKSPTAIVTAILDPNRAVEAKFLQFNALTTAGQVHTGILSNETSTSITLLAAEAKAVTLLRTDLEELQAVSKSLMPEGLEKELSPRGIADLIAFLYGQIPLPQRKQFPGNAPTRVTANAAGAFELTPATCEIYGPTIVLEAKHGNLGWWSSADDFVQWTLEVPTAGRYRVELTWACDPAAAGHRLVVTAHGNRLVHPVAATDGWDDYRTASIGEIDLEQGVQTVALRPASRPLPALMDLKAVRLIPAK